MRKLIVQEFVSVDGMAAAADGSVDFIPAASEGDRRFGQRQLEFMDGVDAIVLGTATYRMFAEYWPNAKSGEDKEFAARINETPKFVFSSTLQRAPWGEFEEATIVRERAEEALPRMKKYPGKDMVIWGSIGLAQSLLAAGVVDDVQLIVCPVVLGEGRRLFEKPLESLNLEASRSFDRGNVLLDYVVTAASKSPRASGAAKEPLDKKTGKRHEPEKVRRQSRRKPVRQSARRS
jgi:dihydrofolate reductase